MTMLTTRILELGTFEDGSPALMVTVGAATLLLLRVTEEQLERLQGEIQTVLGGPSLLNPWPVCKTCGGPLAQAKRIAPDRTFWVHEMSGMDTHAPEPATR
jgi:hypothetical protein